MYRLVSILLIIISLSCSNNKGEKTNSIEQTSYVKYVGAMKDVMWKGELFGKVNLDTLKNKQHLYGVGPLEYLSGEILIIDGKSYHSVVNADMHIQVNESFDVKAPFLVYANNKNWNKYWVRDSIPNINALESYIIQKTKHLESPFVFRLKGSIIKANIHIQNLPKNSEVHSPEEAHKGQVKYEIREKEVEIVGFFSKSHQGIYTHHDTYLHMHLITQDKTIMGHLDSISFSMHNMQLYLPKD